MKISIELLKDVDFDTFKEFNDGLTTEKDSWSLDLQGASGIEEFYEKHIECDFMIFVDGEPAAHFSMYIWINNANNAIIKKQFSLGMGEWLNGHLETTLKNDHLDIYNHILNTDVGFVHSYVVKNKFQRKGLGKFGLEWHIKYIQNDDFFLKNVLIPHLLECGNGYRDYLFENDFVLNFTHVARTSPTNKGSISMCEKLGFCRMSNQEREIMFKFGKCCNTQHLIKSYDR